MARTRADEDDWDLKNRKRQRKGNGSGRRLGLFLGGAALLLVAGVIVLLVVLRGNPTPPAGLPGDLRSQIIGKWAGSKGAIEFRPDGKLLLGPVTTEYRFRGDILEFNGFDHTVEIKDDTMTIMRAEEAIPLEHREKNKQTWKRVK